VIFALSLLVVLVDGIWQVFGAKILLVFLPPAAFVAWRRVQRKRQRAAARAYQAWLDQHVATTNSMSPVQFEELIARLLVRDGHTQVRVVGGRGDLGADVVSANPQGCRVVVQCKRYLGQPVGSRDVQRFLGTVWTEHRADVGIFVTTSRFTADALALGRRNGLRMIDRTALAEWMADGALSAPADLRSSTDVEPPGLPSSTLGADALPPPATKQS
jgi:restriction endonuclease Mrr